MHIKLFFSTFFYCAVRFDVFLSHKRVDARDFARALYNLLIVRGFKTFLDFEYRLEIYLSK